MVKRKLLISSLVLTSGLALMACGYAICLGYTQPISQPQVITKYTTVVREIEVLSEPIEIIKTVETVKEVPIALKDFKSTDELEAFLKKSTANYTVLKVDEWGRNYLNQPTDYDCDDYAQALQKDAEQAGFRINLQYEQRYTRPDTREYLVDHMLNTTVIKGKLYYIEPQTDEFWLETPLD